MRAAWLVVLSLTVGLGAGEGQANPLAGTQLVTSYVVFRHGDRTPDEDELELNAETAHLNPDIFFPYGTKALTNKGKRRGYAVGQYLRRRYQNDMSFPLYLTDEMSIRTTDFARTKMTVLAALAAMYPPWPLQKWNPNLDWQPIPYDTLPRDEDDMMYWYNCPKYHKLRDRLERNPEIVDKTNKYKDFFAYVSKYNGVNVTNFIGIFYLDNLFQALENINYKTPKWAQDIMPKIKEATKIEYALEFYTDEMIQLATGTLLYDIMNETAAYRDGHHRVPKLRLFSAHENNVAALMAACRVFKPHQPKYGATFALEHRTRRLNDGTTQHGFVAVYAPDAGGPAEILPIRGCGGGDFCDYDTFQAITRNLTLTREQYIKQCLSSPSHDVRIYLP